jgi:hypothetical protein
LPDDHIAGVDADTQLKLPVEQLRKPALHRERGVQCTLGVIFGALGAPNAAITASPANFSTVPPARSISSAIAS